MCQDILNNVKFGCESELWGLRFGEWHIFLPMPGQRHCAQNVGIKHVNLNICDCFANKVHIEMFIKFITLFCWSASYKK